MAIDTEAERRRILVTLLPGLASEGLLDAVLAVEALLVAMAPHGVQRWRLLSRFGLLSHLDLHTREVVGDPHRIDGESMHLSAAHLASRALMTLQAVLEPGGWE